MDGRDMAHSSKKCGKKTNQFHDYDKERRIIHLDIMNKPVIVCYNPRRYIYHYHGNHEVTTTATPSFHDTKSNFMYDHEAMLLLSLFNSTIKDI